MFTVKVIRPDSNEDLYEARELTKEPNGILMQTDTETIYLAPTGHMLSLDALNEHRKRGREPQAEHALVYVMNRFGSTVATYNL